jgi:hypothetical protein
LKHPPTAIGRFLAYPSDENFPEKFKSENFPENFKSENFPPHITHAHFSGDELRGRSSCLSERDVNYNNGVNEVSYGINIRSEA